MIRGFTVVFIRLTDPYLYPLSQLTLQNILSDVKYTSTSVTVTYYSYVAEMLWLRRELQPWVLKVYASHLHNLGR